MDNLKDFSPSVVDKVMRLHEVLYEIQMHPNLKNKLAMHGGTALNLFLFDIPRLSVDIDLSYIGAVSRKTMLEEKPIIEESIFQVANQLGYNVQASKPEHAGRSFQFKYQANNRLDSIKIDLIYMNRSPLLPLVDRHSKVSQQFNMLLFDDLELIGGKVKAFYDRVKIRDLYDLSNIKNYLDNKPTKNYYQIEKMEINLSHY